MYQKVFLLLSLLLMIFSVSGDIYHEVEADKDYIDVNSTIQLQCVDNCPVNQWQFSYTLPEDSEVQRVGDSWGEISEYSRQGETIEIETNSASPREEEYIEIQYRVYRSAEEIHDGLYTRSISFAGFEGRETSGTINVDNLISGRSSYGFEASYTDKLDFTGEGPAQVVFNFGQGQENQYYSFFPESAENREINTSEEAYEIALGTVGHYQRFQRFPVAVQREQSYAGFEWSAGEYRAGLIRLRDDDETRPVLAHETVHGLNDKLLRWDRTSSDWFDEGVAKHAEDLVRKKLYRTERSDSRPGELFGEDVSYSDFEQGLEYTVPSRGDREELWSYYQNDQDFMKDWAPRKGNRDFGYAYSELVIKNYLYNGGDLHSLYSEVDPGRTIESNDEKWSIYSEHLDLRPCEYESREAFDACIDEINSHDFQVRAAAPIGNRSTLDIEELEVPEREEKPFSEVFMYKLDELILELIAAVEQIWKNF